jgi:hypothetical protein
VGSNVYEDKEVRRGDGFRYIWMQANVNTLKFKRDNRFVFDGRAWRVVEYDTLTHQGLQILTVEEHQINEVNDNELLNIPDANNQPLYQNPSVEQLIGSDNILTDGFSEVYTINNVNLDEYTFSVTSGGSYVTLSGATDNSITLTTVSNVEGEEVVLRATNTSTLSTFDKIIDIVNGW